MIRVSPHTTGERALLVGVDLRGRGTGSLSSDAEESLEELAELAASAGALVAGSLIQTRSAPEAATLIGSGKVKEVAALARSEGAELAIFDRDLTPTQQRNLEDRLECRVIDRTQLILDIFARRARTREGRLQVELAQLNYLLPRLTGRGKEMSRLGGGIGTRGPGETQLETDRRRIARRIRKIEDDLEAVRKARGIHRRRRNAVPLATAALVGYTNAGKSTLFNRLTRAAVAADARMFATLDPTVRSLDMPSRRRILLSDTVGFIRKLPTTLVKAFRATLEEVAEATLTVHVVDVSSPHAAAHVQHVLEVLREIGAGEIPQILVLNKIDRLPERIEAAAAGSRLMGDRGHVAARAVPISALTGEGVGDLLAAIDASVPLDPVSVRRFRIPLDRPAPLALVHQRGRILATHYTGEHCEIEAEVPESLCRRLADFLDE